MKYFVKGWDNNIINSKKVIKKYNNYYKTIEKQISVNVKNVLCNRHDSHILKAYFQETDYIMELEEKIWGKAYIVFKNATVKKNINIKDDYWLYDEIYKIKEEYEIHILFNKSDIIIKCSDAYIRLKNKEYFKALYKKEDYSIDLANSNKKDIASVVMDKEFVCGYIMLNTWEQLIYSFMQIYVHIKYYKYNNIEEKLTNHYYELSEEERKNTYQILFSKLEERLIESIKILEKYKETINEKDLNDIISKFLAIYNKNDITIERKNQLYLNLGEEVLFDLNNIYKIILQYIDKNFI